MGPSRHRNWVFTAFKPEGESLEGFEECIKKIYCVDATQYCIFQVEKAPDTQAIHAQGYFQLKNPKSLTGVKRSFSGIHHYEPRRGTHKEAIEYCSKEESRVRAPVSFGLGKDDQGFRSDLERCKAMLDDGKSMRDISDECFRDYIKYHRAFENYRLIHTPLRRWQTHTTVIWGLSGAGKTFKVKQLCAEIENGDFEATYWLHAPTDRRVWWDGYSGQRTVIIDEFEGWMANTFMKRLLDENPFKVETKFGFVEFVAERIFITSNRCPTRWWRRGLGAVRRRIQGDKGVVYFMDNPVTHDLLPYDLPQDPIFE